MTNNVRRAARPETGMEVQHALRQEVARALEPALAEFRQRAARTVRQEVDRALRAEGTPPRRGPPPAPDRADERRPGQSVDEVSGLTAGVAERVLRQLAPSGSGRATSAVAGSALGAVPTVLEQQGERWLRSRLEVGRDALCSDPVRAAVRHQTEQVLRPFLEVGLDLLPDEATRRGLRRDAERALDELIGDTLDRVCSGPVWEELEQHWDRLVRTVLHGDVGTALREVGQALRTLLRALVAALRDHWGELFHLVLGVVLEGMQAMIGTALKDGFASLVAAPAKEAEEKTETTQEALKEKGTELRDRLTERVEALRERIADEVGQVKQRVAEGLESAVEGGTRCDSFGRPPNGRPPSLRPPSARPPSGRPPNGRPPSGRPPSATR